MIGLFPTIVFLLCSLAFLSGCASPTVAAVAPPFIPPTERILSPTPTPATPSPTPVGTKTPTLPLALLEPAPASSTRTPTPTDTATHTPAPSETAAQAPFDQAIWVYYIPVSTEESRTCDDQAIALSTGRARSGDLVQDLTFALGRLLNDKRVYVGGLSNPLYLSNLTLGEVVYDQAKQEVTVYIDGTYVRSNDPCDGARVKAQIWSTVRQFSEVKTRNFVFNGQHSLGDFLSNDR